MRYGLLTWSLSVLLLVGCNTSSQPEASRGAAEHTDESSHRDSQLPADDPGLPAGHPPIGPLLGGADEPLDDSGGEVRLDAITLTAPQGWGRKQPQSSFIEAEFALPRAEGDDADGRLTVSTAGGSIEANIDRWKGQFSGQQDSHQEQIDVGGLEVTLVDLTGEFSDQRGPFAPAVTQSDYRMIAAIIPVDGQLHFVKAMGPRKTMASHAEAIENFVRSVKPNS